MELYEVPAGSLDTWIMENLQPSEEFRLQVKDTVRRLCDFLKETCFEDIKLFKTVKGGSAGKGTALKNKSDADLVLFLSCFSSYKDQADKRAAVLSTIEQKLNRCRQSIAYSVGVELSTPKRKGVCPRSLSITIQSKKRQESIEVDMLPAYDALGHVTRGTKPSPQIYEALIRTGAGPGEFCTSFTELQRDFVKRRPAKLKNLLRLVKHWYKELSQRVSGLPAKYALELLTIYAWESGTREAENFSTAEGFRTVMELLVRYRELCVYWTEFYDLTSPVIGPHVKRLLQAPRPVILDPADPTGTLGRDKKWDLLAKEAAVCRDKLCCKNGLAPIRCWDVQPARPGQVMVTQLSGVSLALQLSPFTTFWEVKEELERAWSISPYMQRLALREPRLANQPLPDNTTLASHGIFDSTALLLLVTEPQEMQIFVKAHNGRTSVYDVRANDTVLSLKTRVENQTGVHASQQRLTYDSKELQDDHTLAHYRIRSQSTIFLLLRLRGG
ncbi:2'-5'-oligoadenylate synthase 1-like [Pelodiscus sinensis]|uniref:2'-5'-oligoadenylate synthase 1-like n=1 Tax=Pelodiscus sinensis TaxID=13735 RepID=UPI003F6BF323